MADWLYLPLVCRVQRGTHRARAALAASREKFDTGVLARFDERATEVAAATTPLFWDSSEPSLPAGWCLAPAPEGGLEELEDPQGARFEGRILVNIYITIDLFIHRTVNNYTEEPEARGFMVKDGREVAISDKNQLPAGQDIKVTVVKWGLKQKLYLE